MDEQTPLEAAPRPPRRRGPGPGLAAAAAALGLLAFVGLYGWQFWRPLPVVPPMPAAPASIVYPETVPVVIVSASPSLRLSCPGGASWYAPGERFLDMGEGPWRVTASGEVLHLNDLAVPEGEAQLRPNDDGFVLGEDAYRGHLVLTVRPGDCVRAVNVLPPEQYIAGVVGRELYARWPMEALMAQAVAARTFMLYTLDARGHMVPADMAYRGREAESRPARLATELTAGIVLAYDDRPLPAYFQSTCGGRTVAVERVFALDALPPLRGVECPWCRGTRWYEWSLEVTGADLARRLDRPDVAEVRTLRPLETEPDGYARFVLINDEVKLDAGALRRALGGNRMRSLRFRVTARDGVFSLQGRGYGHGVGLCQWGARGMARAGHTWQEILQHYYPGALVCRAH
ncbi:MAG: SpoIID/LytB domain-containing protein [Candidatus Brocadiaceae bacterium]|nr:SpoIID/LytB domain-containing protein [Candidatus Brocadiaceae bacterium]